MTSIIRGSDNFDTGLGLGVGQTWQDLSGSRSTGVTYTNTTGKPIMVSLSMLYSAAGANLQTFVDGVFISYTSGLSVGNEPQLHL